MIRYSKFHSAAWRLMGSVGGLLAASGCGAPDTTELYQNAPDPAADAQLGRLGLELELGPGVELSSVDWEITGNGFQKAGSVAVHGSATVSLQVGGIPIGRGFSISLTAADPLGLGITCAGSAGFDISSRHTTQVAVRLRCRAPSRTGTVAVQGSVNVCPLIDSLSASPLEVQVGHALELFAQASDIDQGPAALSYVWSSAAGLSGADSAAASLTCSAVGSFEVALSVSDGDCEDQGSLTVTCSEADTALPLIRLNEIESNGGSPGDWVELYNAGSASADVSGWRFLDNDDTHVYTLPAGTRIAPGAYLVLETADFGFGLGALDAARLSDAAGTLVDTYGWAAHAATTYGRCPDGLGAFASTTLVTKGAANDCSSAVVINEVESSGGIPGDWIELYNPGSRTEDLSGWFVLDNDDTHLHSIPAGTTLAPGGYLVIEEANLGFGLGGADSVRLRDASGVTLVDSFTWPAHAATTYGRCPDGVGPSVTTQAASKGSANACATNPSAPSPWPGEDAVGTLDPLDTFAGDMSGLTYQPAGAASPAALWAVKNDTGTLFLLTFNGTSWAPAAGAEWASGKAIRYPDGTGTPDTEGVTRAEGDLPALYVASERNNSDSGVSRLSVLRVEHEVPVASLSATHEWNVTLDLPSVGANAGLEAITWIPDSVLVESAFLDESTGALYDPSLYANHGGGLFFLGLEANGLIYAYALDHSSLGFRRIATLASGHRAIMGLEFDRDTGYLWAACDDTCEGRISVLDIQTDPASLDVGRWVTRALLQRPSTLGNLNHEGIAIVSEAECAGGFKGFFWVDDNATDGHSLRGGSIPCGELFVIGACLRLEGFRR